MTYTEITGLSTTNVPLDSQKLLEWLSGAYTGNPEELLKVLSNDPDRIRDSKTIMRKTGRESSINKTTNQGLGSVIDNLPYYVDSSIWWRNGWNPQKYAKSLTRDKAKVRRKPVPRIANR